MERIPVKSSQVKSIGYAEQDQILEVEFSSGGIYQYKKVPYLLYRTFLAAEHKGTFHAEFIRGKYEYVRLHIAACIEPYSGVCKEGCQCWCHKPKKEKKHGQDGKDQKEEGKDSPTTKGPKAKAKKRIS